MSTQIQQSQPMKSQTNDTPLPDEVLDQVSGGDVNGQGGSDVIIGSVGLAGRDSNGTTDLTSGAEDEPAGTGGIQVALMDGSVR